MSCWQTPLKLNHFQEYKTTNILGHLCYLMKLFRQIDQWLSLECLGPNILWVWYRLLNIGGIGMNWGNCSLLQREYQICQYQSWQMKIQSQFRLHFCGFSLNSIAYPFPVNRCLVEQNWNSQFTSIREAKNKMREDLWFLGNNYLQSKVVGNKSSWHEVVFKIVQTRLIWYKICMYLSTVFIHPHKTHPTYPGTYRP